MKTATFVFLSVSFTAAMPVFAALPTAPPAAAWPFYRGPHGDGTTTEAVSKRMWSSSGPTQVWKAPTTNGFSSFCVADGKAFTLVSRDVDGNLTEVLIALDAATGKETWAFPLKIVKYDNQADAGEPNNGGGTGPQSTPSFLNGKVYVMGYNLDLHCLNAADGKVVWEHDITKDFHGPNIHWGNAASPLIEDGTVFVAGGGPGESLIALKADTGDVVWKGQDDKMTHATPVAATIDGVRQIIFFTQKGLVAVTPKTGEVLWRYAFPYKVSTAASPIVYQNLVYCAAGYGVGMGCAEVRKSGDKFEAKEIWRKEGDAVTNHWSTPVCKDGYLYGMFSFKQYGKGPLLCLEMKTGEVKWRQDGYGSGQIILAGDTVVALSDRGELALVEAKPNGYKQLARADVLEGKCWSTPVLVAGRVYARSTKEAVCVDLR